MQLTCGKAEVKVGLIDGPVAINHPDLAETTIQHLSSSQATAEATGPGGIAERHGTLVAGILSANRDSLAPAICPGCTILVYRLFAQSPHSGELIPSATPQELAAAIVECLMTGAWIINLSAAIQEPSTHPCPELEEALDEAARRGVMVVAAAGNQGAIGSTPITRHPWVIPVAACQTDGQPMDQTNLANSIGRRGLRAPGEEIVSLEPEGGTAKFSGTSAAAPFVSGAAALLWSLFPGATGGEIRQALVTGLARHRPSLVPPLLDATIAYQALNGLLVRKSEIAKSVAR